ncbi:pre-rRNA-processing protein PNO1 [Thecamonas trahens ATCC 50062]|uniref:Pre-rRNA-processing protein PNO1 n=1 Tax=Thecamonas trahens ATCC 50062 TaxID=461836 RepID=A0A0L0D2B7_THETB|nr:pre-rRNA-processing protein PNO1 [Thecamonas trahens ATCC 50062]KNC46280.1 pre-rRNA-processing protein PNO1 [Thecamonas trahens ATCC 50062]|eukprot:XP_013760574.1 pre-rRNA-processing protein PNO1 [Thecamonas trahens ATCC 50062]
MADDDMMLMQMEDEEGTTFGAEELAAAGEAGEDDDELEPLENVGTGNLPEFTPVDPTSLIEVEEVRRLPVPPHRYTPLKQNWEHIVDPIVNVLGLAIQMNVKARKIEIQNCEYTTDSSALQRAADFVKAFLLGFDLDDAMALLRLDDLYVDSFEIDDVKRLQGNHRSRAIGRICGAQGKTKHTIENALRVRIVVADSKIHILGAFTNIKLARRAVCSLIMGTPPGKVYGQLRSASARLATRY